MALHLVRKRGQRIIINGNITLEVTKVKDGNVTLSFVYPETSSVYREELINKAKAFKAETENL